MESNEQNRMPESDYERTVPLTVQKTKKSRAPIVLSLLLVLALAGCGALGYFAYDQSNQRASAQGKLGVKDEQVSQLQKQLSDANSAAETAETESNDVTTDTSNVSSADLIKTAIAFSKLKVANQGYPEKSTNLTGEIDKQSSDFARVQVGSSAGPGVDLVYFKKVDSQWKLLGGDNNNPDRFRQTFGLPNDF